MPKIPLAIKAAAVGAITPAIAPDTQDENIVRINIEEIIIVKNRLFFIYQILVKWA